MNAYQRAKAARAARDAKKEVRLSAMGDTATTSIRTSSDGTTASSGGGGGGGGAQQHRSASMGHGHAATSSMRTPMETRRAARSASMGHGDTNADSSMIPRPPVHSIRTGTTPKHSSAIRGSIDEETAATGTESLDNVPSATTSTKKAEGEGYGVPLDNVTEMIGNTPLVKLSDRLTQLPEVTIYAKAEYCNPLSSVKDRLAKAIIEDAERSGKLRPGATVIEATSGNTGIAIAMVCAQRGYKCVIVMAEQFSKERRSLMRMLGARVVLTPKSAKGIGMVEKARELAELNGWFLCRQFETDSNWKYHERATGPEIMNDLGRINKNLDYFVSGYGTGGTFHGASKYIKSVSPTTKCILAEPKNAALVKSKTTTRRNYDGSAMESHPSFTGHPIQGWTPDFIALNLEKGLKKGLMDDLVLVPDNAAIQTARSLARTEGILTGISGGATVWSAIEIAKTSALPGDTIVCIMPDTGERYLSTPLFDSITSVEHMTNEEMEISQSSPSHAFW